MSGRYPGYDVLAKRDSPSWNEQTRNVIDQRLRIEANFHRFFTDTQWPTVLAICERIIPQPPHRARPVPIAAMLDEKLFENRGDGYRDSRLPPLREAWRRGLQAIDLQAQGAYGARFHQLQPLSQEDLLRAAQEGRSRDPAWGDMPAHVFFAKRLLHDIVTAYYSHPSAWNEIGFGGPASPRGYVRMDFDRRDPWEAAEARPGLEEEARRKNDRI